MGQGPLALVRFPKGETLWPQPQRECAAREQRRRRYEARGGINKPHESEKWVKGHWPLSGFQWVKPFGGFGQSPCPQPQRECAAREQRRRRYEARGGRNLPHASGRSRLGAISFPV